MATWDDFDTYEADSESDDEKANIALMANITEDSEASESDSESDTKEVFPDFAINFTKNQMKALMKFWKGINRSESNSET